MPPANGLAPLRIAGCAGARVLDEGAAGVLQLRVLHRDLHPAAAAGGVALEERAQDADRQQHAGAGVAEGRARLARAPVALAGDRHRAAAGLGDHVEGEVVLVGAALAEALDLARRSRRGFSACRSSQPSPSRSIAPGAKFSTKTSARLAISLTSARPRSDLRLTVTDFLLAL